MTDREKLKRLVIEAIHGLPYDEAVRKELEVAGCQWLGSDGVNAPMDCKTYKGEVLQRGIGLDGKVSELMLGNMEVVEIIGLPITIGRVMVALWNSTKGEANIPLLDGNGMIGRILSSGNNWEPRIKWKLINKDGSECEDEDQSDETIEGLVKLLEEQQHAKN